VWRIGFWIDLVQTVIGAYGGFLFAWWWFVLGRASTVYAMVMAIFFGFAIQNGVNLYYRHCLLIDPSTCVERMHGMIWNLRDVLTTIGLTTMVVAMTLRAARTIKSVREIEVCRDKLHEDGKKNTSCPEKTHDKI
jgi:hypothetical protein